MALPPVPSNLTNKFFLDYVTGTQASSSQHTVQLRLDAAIDDAAVPANFLTILNGIGAGNLWTGWKAIGLRKQLANTNFSIPIAMGATLTAFVGTGLTSGYVSTAEAIELTCQGRSTTTGRRVDFSIYGLRITTPLTSFRKTYADGAPYNSLLAAIQAPSTQYLTADGSQAAWYSYVNLNYNSYWEQQIRTA